MDNTITKYDLQTAISNGIALDFLLFFTTSYGTAAVRTVEEIGLHYPHIANVESLVDRLIELQLLVERIAYDFDNHWQPTQQTGQIRLTHDTLAPVIRTEFNRSSYPGQVARKLLEQKVEVAKSNRHILLSGKELEVLENGVAGMRHKTDEERNLVAKSNQKHRKRKRQFIFGDISFDLINRK